MVLSATEQGERSQNMYTPKPDEKITKVMIYTQTVLIRGEVLNKANVRVSTWLRTEGVPDYIHILQAQVLFLTGSPFKTVTFPEFLFPSGQIIGFHIIPPAADPPDYDLSEANRIMQPVTIMLGTFTIKGKLRISTKSDVSTSIQSARAVWLSIYEANISNPYLPQMALEVPMLLLRSSQAGFALEQ
jgi:hypothetical protein